MIVNLAVLNDELRSAKRKIDQLEKVLQAERARSSHGNGCHEYHPICAYLRSTAQREVPRG
jgi:hypothetical protein